MRFILPSLLAVGVASARPIYMARNTTPSSRATPNGKVIIQMFQWSWESIATECTDFIGPAGYGFVQVSPPAEHVTGPEWFTDYQPVSYQLISKRGNRDQFSTMVSTCKAAGVDVIVDTVLNHMTGTDSGEGVAGSNFTHFEYPGIYKDENFHHCGLTDDDDIADFTNRVEVQTCELVNLADLATETDPVRETLTAYVTDLLSLGVAGFRLDAAKHIPTEDIAAILGGLTGDFYVSQEVGIGPGETVTTTEYIPNGDVQDFGYTSRLMTEFSAGGNLTNLQDLSTLSVPSENANIFVANHDTERGATSLNTTSASNTYITATIFSLAHPYGTPTVLSGYEFTDINAGAPTGGAGVCSENGGAEGWTCQHRFIAVSGMVGFRNTVGTEALSDFVSPQQDQIAFGRGSAGFVAINNADADWDATFTTTLADGSYCDVIGGKSVDDSCTGNAITVTGGSFKSNVVARGAIAIHTGALGSAAAAPVAARAFDFE